MPKEKLPVLFAGSFLSGKLEGLLDVQKLESGASLFSGKMGEKLFSGALTLQVARALKRVGLIWGSDIGLLGFDELEWAELAGVGITTLKQPTWQIGYAAVEQVIRRIAGTNDPIRERVFSGELIVRGSTSR